MDLFGKSLIELQELIKTKKVSSKEVFDYFAKRSKKYNPKLNAFHTLLDKPVTESSATGGSLYGIPFSMKDTYNTKGVQTTASSRVIDDYIPPYNATVYERLVKAGITSLSVTPDFIDRTRQIVFDVEKKLFKEKNDTMNLCPS